MWSGEAGIKRIMQVAVPVVINSSSFTVMAFIDRKFLLLHSFDSFSASAPAGMLAFSFIAFFFGTVTFSNSLIAQYFGAGRPTQVGRVLWQGIYCALASYFLVLPAAFFAPEIFSFVGHSPGVQVEESIYFSIIHAGSIFLLLTTVLSSLFNGIGRTQVVMWVGLGATFLNIPLDYLLIFGGLGIPALGIKGAAIATVIAQAFGVILYLILLTRPKVVSIYGLRKMAFHSQEFLKLLKFGIPSGIQLIIIHFGFTFFLLMAGRLGEDVLAASNAAWSMDNLIFMPIFGCHIATSVLAGQLIGAKKWELLNQLTRNAFLVSMIYVFPASMIFLFAPEFGLAPLLSGASGDDYTRVMDLAKVYIRFVAFYAFFDATGMTIQGVLKGAGDTSFIMYTGLFCSIVFMVIPCYLIATVFHADGSYLWLCATLYVLFTGVISLARYLQGGWRNKSLV
ncbi:MAG: MATE family efflux transporter [Bacteriovoracaceae bacterium]|nr:MATE family efflux transporter [Bacteriovoracaceae bacterium]